MTHKWHYLKRDLIFVMVIIVIMVVIFLFPLPAGLQSSENDYQTMRATGMVLETDNSHIKQFGIVKTGTQDLKIKLLNTQFKDRILTATNPLTGRMEFDKLFSKGDKALITLHLDDDRQKIIQADVVDHYRINLELLLFIIFVLFLLVFSGFTGFKAVISFIFTILMIWKIFIPLVLKGWPPVGIALAITFTITFVVIFLVGGVNRKGLVAFLGSMLGILLTCLLSYIFGHLFRIHGAVRPFSETLLYSGYPHLNLSQIFLAGIFIASSGAVMDLAMDISTAMREVVDKHPGISTLEAIKSGFTVGKAVVGTMTTTLLLAYTGSYTTMLMVFMAKKTPAINILNINYVAAEILHTIVGSFGMVTVAPITAILGGLFFVRLKQVRLLITPRDQVRKEDQTSDNRE